MVQINPFLENKEFNIKVVTVSKTTTHTNAGSSTRTTVETLVEVQDKVSVYKIGNRKEQTAFMFSMNRHAREVYLYMLCMLGENQDTIYLNQEKVCEATTMGRNSYYEAIENLKSHSVICPYKRNEFWVNPFIMFRGDRLAYYRDQCPECIENASTVHKEAEYGLIDKKKPVDNTFNGRLNKTP